MNSDEIIKRIKLLSDADAVKGMARFGINPTINYGVSVTALRKMGKDIGKNHDLAMDLWDSEIHDCRLLATIIGEPERLTEEQAERMLKTLDSWDVCDQFCIGLMRHTPFAFSKAKEWTTRKPEFEKRAAFSLMATLAVANKSSSDSKFESFFPLIETHSSDERNYVKKSVNWALRSIGKRNRNLNEKAMELAIRLRESESKPARWIGRDAARELGSVAVKNRLEKTKGK